MNLRRMARMGVEAGLDLLFPRSCVSCGSAPLGPSDGFHVCWSCLSSVMLIKPPFCSICGQPVFGMIDQAYHCHACHQERPAFDHARSCALHEGLARDWVVAFKYRQNLWLANDLGMLMTSCAFQALPANHRPDGVLGVPLYAAKRRERGYNQAALLARAVARRMQVPYYAGFLRRVRPTNTQTKLTSPQRKLNVAGAFTVRWPRWIEGRSFLLVDDVMTTGATANECARVLKQAGAARVDVLTLARGVL